MWFKKLFRKRLLRKVKPSPGHWVIIIERIDDDGTIYIIEDHINIL